MQIIQDTALKTRLPVSVAQAVLSDITRSQQVGNEVLVAWDFLEAQFLAAQLDRLQPDASLPDVPSPMLRDYTWPGIYTPFEHQRHTASYLSIRQRAFCFNEAGTGKTGAAIWAADYLMNIGMVHRVLVICPVSIMYTAWQADIFKTAMHRTCGVAYGDKKKREKVIGDVYDFVVINYDGIAVVKEALLAGDFDLIIVDEANAYKDSTTKRWRQLASLIGPHVRLWMMTGTPASQSPVDAFGMARLVSSYRVPKFKTAWRDKVMLQASRFRWIPKPTAQSDVFHALQPAIRYTKAECLDLPEVIYQTREVPMTTQAHNYYKIMRQEMLIEACNEQVSAVNAAIRLNKLLQISGGAVYTDDHNVIEFDISHRLHALKEVLDETINKVIVFVPFTHTIQIVSEYLQAQGISSEVIDGSVTAKRRADIINSFQMQTDPQVLVIQPQAASHGVTLTAADTVVFWSPVMQVETYLQCIARIDRVGQKNHMLVVHLQGSDAERRQYASLQGKVTYHNGVVGLYNDVIHDTTH